MRNEIKETCGCGATLHFTEDLNYSYNRDTDCRQKAFHEAHKRCRDLLQKPTHSPL